MGTFVSISGGGNANVHIYGDGSVVAGNGNDTITIDGNGSITVGAGNDHITLNGSGSITQYDTATMQGHDTINLGSGSDSLSEAGRATVYGAFGSATVEGGKFEFLRLHGSSHDDRHDDGSDHGSHQGGKFEEIALSGKATLVGGDHCTKFVGGTGSVVMQGGSGNDTFVGGSGHDTMWGGSGHNLFEFTSSGKGGTDVIQNFVSGHDKLYLEGQTLSYLQSHGDITVSHGNTYISLDGGKTTVELKGFTNLTSHDITGHKG
jgi:Ca2+-binding RTX toxin-like protein